MAGPKRTPGYGSKGTDRPSKFSPAGKEIATWRAKARAQNSSRSASSPSGRRDPWAAGGTLSNAMKNADKARAGLRKAGWGR